MNILIIGSSNAIKKLFQDKFKGNNINYISFRSHGHQKKIIGMILLWFLGFTSVSQV